MIIAIVSSPLFDTNSAAYAKVKSLLGAGRVLPISLGDDLQHVERSRELTYMALMNIVMCRGKLSTQGHHRVL